ncbi:MAG: hypothetical protein BRD55_04425 [Bacteroidetes bacterium SW_9_63_38]|nr:MAG: hypothetical protein BRD55_04425 [Bacteroidetes bacterium SW_9_63_38]
MKPNVPISDWRKLIHGSVWSSFSLTVDEVATRQFLRRVHRTGFVEAAVWTLGLCFIGTLVDAVNYKSIAFRYNREQADEVAAMVR